MQKNSGDEMLMTRAKVKNWLRVATVLGYSFMAFQPICAAQGDHAGMHKGQSSGSSGHSTEHVHMSASHEKSEAAQTKSKPHEHQHIHPVKSSIIPAGTDQTSGVGIDEKLGQLIFLDASFKDEKGATIKLGDRIDKPTLLLPVFYHCPMTCDMMMANLAAALNKVNLKAGEDFHVMSFSFDDEDTPKIAYDSKINYTKILKAGFPENSWNFLTGNAPDIRRVTDSAGYHFKKTGPHDFIHPNALIVLANDGMIIRYLYGPSFLPFDISMALTEATRGTPSVSIKKLLTYCFDYDPKGKKYVFKTFRIMGSVIFLTLGLFYFFVLRRGKKDRQIVEDVKGERNG